MAAAVRAIASLALPVHERDVAGPLSNGMMIASVRRSMSGQNGARTYRNRSRYMPHQGKREMARRVRQMQRAAERRAAA